MDLRRRLLWVDGLAGLTAGSAMLLLSRWLSELHNLPLSLLIFMGIANLSYGTFSTTLALRSSRPQTIIACLAIANLTWAMICFALALNRSSDATLFGMTHLIGEGLIVGGLGCLEWRWRTFLTKA